MSAATAVMPLREVRLYGHLGQRFGRLYRLAVATPAEAVRALCAVLPGFEKAFLGCDGRAAYHVFIGRRAARRDINVDQAQEPIGATEPIRFVPVVAGAKRGGALQTIVGAVLIVVGAVLAFNGYVGLGDTLIKIGGSMLVGGVVQLLSTQRVRKDERRENAPSYAFDGPVNNVEQGGPVPLIFGRVICGSTVVSQGLSSDDLVIPSSAPPDPTTLPGYEPPIYENAGGD